MFLITQNCERSQQNFLPVAATRRPHAANAATACILRHHRRLPEQAVRHLRNRRKTAAIAGRNVKEFVPAAG